jgi:polysaccharidase protein
LFGITFATDYYVDALSGNNSNTGTGELTAWKTLSKIPTLNPGEQVFIKRDSVFTGSDRLNVKGLGTEVAPIRYGAYGS